jgi:hypothetical protein
MRPTDGPGPLDILVVILSPVIAAALVVVYLAGWWTEAVWRWVSGERGE